LKIEKAFSGSSKVLPYFVTPQLMHGYNMVTLYATARMILLSHQLNTPDPSSTAA